jgi:hypothetical protein
MSGRTIAEFCYMAASAVVTWFVARAAVWSYPQGSATIWPIGWVAIAFVVGLGFKPFLDSWRLDRAGARPATDD